MKINQVPTKKQTMRRLASTLMRSTIMRINNTRCIAAAIASLFTHVAFAQSHQDLAAVIAGGNDALSEAVYGLQTTAYANGNAIQVAGEGQATALDLSASNFGVVNFSDAILNNVNTVVIRFDNASQTASSLDLAPLSALENLSNVILLFAFDITATEAASLELINIPSGATSYYSISIPE